MNEENLNDIKSLKLNKKITKRNENHLKRYNLSDTGIEMSDEYPRIMEMLGNPPKYKDFYGSKFILDKNKKKEVKTLSIILNREQRSDALSEVNKLDNGDRSTVQKIKNKDFLIGTQKAYGINADNLNDKTEIQVERYEILKETNHWGCGLNAKILRHLKADGSDKIILWADGSKGWNNVKDILKRGWNKLSSIFKKNDGQNFADDSLDSIQRDEDLQFSKDENFDSNQQSLPPIGEVLRETFWDWFVSDVATAFGIINRQTKHLREFAMDYMYDRDGTSTNSDDMNPPHRIDIAIGTSLAGIAMSTLGYTKDFENTKIYAYSGGTKKSLHDKAIKQWGDNGLHGRNITNILTPGEPLSQIFPAYYEENTLLMLKPKVLTKKKPHGANFYTNLDGKNSTYYFASQKEGNEGRFPLYYVSSTIPIIKEGLSKNKALDEKIQPIADKKYKKRKQKQARVPEIPAVNMAGGENGINPNILEDILKETMPAIDSETAQTSPPILFSSKDNVDLGSALADFVKTMLLEDAIPTSSGHSTLEKEINNATKVRNNNIDKIMNNIMNQKSVLSGWNRKNENALKSLDNRLNTKISEPKQTVTENFSKMQEQYFKPAPVFETINDYRNYELMEEIEYCITSILEDFVTRMGYDRYNYN